MFSPSIITRNEFPKSFRTIVFQKLTEPNKPYSITNFPNRLSHRRTNAVIYSQPAPHARAPSSHYCVFTSTFQLTATRLIRGNFPRAFITRRSNGRPDVRASWFGDRLLHSLRRRDVTGLGTNNVHNSL